MANKDVALNKNVRTKTQVVKRSNVNARNAKGKKNAPKTTRRVVCHPPMKKKRNMNVARRRPAVMKRKRNPKKNIEVLDLTISDSESEASGDENEASGDENEASGDENEPSGDENEASDEDDAVYIVSWTDGGADIAQAESELFCHVEADDESQQTVEAEEPRKMAQRDAATKRGKVRTAGKLTMKKASIKRKLAMKKTQKKGNCIAKKVRTAGKLAMKKVSIKRKLAMKKTQKKGNCIVKKVRTASKLAIPKVSVKRKLAMTKMLKKGNSMAKKVQKKGQLAMKKVQKKTRLATKEVQKKGTFAMKQVQKKRKLTTMNALKKTMDSTPTNMRDEGHFVLEQMQNTVELASDKVPYEELTLEEIQTRGKLVPKEQQKGGKSTSKEVHTAGKLVPKESQKAGKSALEEMPRDGEPIPRKGRMNAEQAPKRNLRKKMKKPTLVVRKGRPVRRRRFREVFDDDSDDDEPELNIGLIVGKKAETIGHEAGEQPSPCAMILRNVNDQLKELLAGDPDEELTLEELTEIGARRKAAKATKRKSAGDGENSNPAQKKRKTDSEEQSVMTSQETEDNEGAKDTDSGTGPTTPDGQNSHTIVISKNKTLNFHATRNDNQNSVMPQSHRSIAVPQATVAVNANRPMSVGAIAALRIRELERIKRRVMKQLAEEKRQRPVAEVKRQHPVAEVERPRPVAEGEFQHPVAEVERQRPVAEVERQRPEAEVERQRPVAEVRRQRPVAEVERPRPEAEVDRQRPIAEVERQHPVAEVERQHPVAEVERQHPFP